MEEDIAYILIDITFIILDIILLFMNIDQTIKIMAILGIISCGCGIILNLLNLKGKNNGKF